MELTSEEVTLRCRVSVCASRDCSHVAVAIVVPEVPGCISVEANWPARPEWQAKLIRVSNPTAKGAQYNDQ